MEITSERGQEMLGYLPPVIYGNSDVMKALLESEGQELDALREAIEGAFDQMFVRRADDWGLDKWEEELGLIPKPSLSIAERQDRIVAHLRGYGTATIEVVKGVAVSYVYGLVDVDDESTDPALPDYTIQITFIDEHGIPSYFADLQDVLRRVVPAHLDIIFEFNYTTWDDVDTINAGAPWTWDQWDTADAGGPLTWDEMEVFA